MSARRAPCGCVYKPRGNGIAILKRCPQHTARDMPRGAPYLAALAMDVAYDAREPEDAAEKVAQLCADRDEDDRAELLALFEELLAEATFTRLLEPPAPR